MSRRVRLGFVVAGVLLLVWTAQSVTIDRVLRDPPPPNVTIIRLELGALPGLHVRPGTNVEIKCTAENDGKSIAFACQAREKVRAK